MTVEAQNPDGTPIVRSGPYNGNGVTVAFPYLFPITTEAEVRVLRQNADLSEDVLELATDYTVTGVGSGAGGTVELVSGALLPTGAKLALLLDMAFDQPSAYSNQGRIHLELLETSLDKLTLMTRQLKELVARAITVDAFTDDDPGTVVTSVFAARVAAEAAAAASAVSAADALAKENSMLRARNGWLTATEYAPSDIVRSGSAQYLCLVAHTSGTFSTDLSAARWAVWLQDGAVGPGGGDVLGANNGSEFADKPTTLANLGGQPAHANLTALASPTYARGDVIRRGASALERFALGTNRQVLGSNGTDLVYSTPIVSQSFVSAEQTIVLDTLYTLAHGLGARPKVMTAAIICKTAQYGWAVGNEIDLSVPVMDWNGADVHYGYSDASNVYYRLGSRLQIPTKGSLSVPGGITPGSWRLILRAYA